MKKNLEYLRYITRHKYYVFVAGRKLGVSFKRLIFHDWVKFLPCEWLPYLRFFYGDYAQKDFDEFNRAFLHHWHSQDHHWQHWLKIADSGGMAPMKMDPDAALEMVADWAGAGRAIAGEWEFTKWYLKNKLAMKLHPQTRVEVEGHLKQLQGLI